MHLGLLLTFADLDGEKRLSKWGSSFQWCVRRDSVTNVKTLQEGDVHLSEITQIWQCAYAHVGGMAHQRAHRGFRRAEPTWRCHV